MTVTSLFGEPLGTQYVLWLVDGLDMTVRVSLAVAVASTLLGFLLALLRISGVRVVTLLVATYVALFRNTPLLVQLFFWYFGLPGLLSDDAMLWLNSPHVLSVGGVELSWPSFECLVATLGLTAYSTAFVVEEIRAGLRGVPDHQRLSAEALGMQPWPIFRYVVLPQALRIALPPLLGQYMNIVKNSSLAMAIGLVELSYASRQVESETFKTFQAFAIATLFYILVIAVIEAVGQCWAWQQRAKARAMGKTA
ncbi:ABC transporter permease subunit [Rhodocyclus tenuis]|uniref:amino acid ABC transporter permease n=1 Tax=Rhodocyclus gracilis TaxID=2929842 RepID=UPI0012988F39|nr:amino acid ABC transporter permease [Rhodocyclus gracilis]MRD73729.1 ABC transporter permease subunit [Rhodocyclus gracilis]